LGLGFLFTLSILALGCSLAPTVVIALFGEEVLGAVGEYDAVLLRAFQNGEGRRDFERQYLAVLLLHSHLHLMGIMSTGMGSDNAGFTLNRGLKIGQRGQR
jgi:hypothetical protein